MYTEIRVSTDSWPWEGKFLCRLCRASNLQPFHQESSALTTEPSLARSQSFCTGLALSFAVIAFTLWLLSRCDCFHAVIAFTLWLLSHCDCFHTVIAFTLWLLSHCDCFHAVIAFTNTISLSSPFPSALTLFAFLLEGIQSLVQMITFLIRLTLCCYNINFISLLCLYSFGLWVEVLHYIQSVWIMIQSVLALFSQQTTCIIQVWCVTSDTLANWD